MQCMYLTLFNCCSHDQSAIFPRVIKRQCQLIDSIMHCSDFTCADCFCTGETHDAMTGNIFHPTLTPSARNTFSELRQGVLTFSRIVNCARSAQNFINLLFIRNIFRKKKLNVVFDRPNYSSPGVQCAPK